MSLPRYAEYKDSGVPWLGEVPTHWTIAPVKHLGKLKGGAGFPHVEQGHETEELPFHKVNALGRAGSEGVLWGSENNISRATAERLGAYIFPANALVFAKVGAALLLGRIRTLGESACIDNNMMGLVVDNDSVDVAFVSYALNLVRFDLIANPGAVPSLNEGQIGNFPLVLPSQMEQSAIAVFLDRETGKIDALIAEQEKLLTLLAEKRQATISHAVTRGLNPNAPMKDSGVPWLGEMPAHWELFSLKRELMFLTSGSRGWAEHYADEGALFLRIGNLTRDSVRLDLNDIQRVAIPDGSEGERTRVEQGDVLFSITAYLGSVAVVPEGLEQAFVSQHVALARLQKKRLRSAWVAYVTLSRLGAMYLAAQGYGGTKVQLSLGDIADLPITVPPLDEQDAALDFIEREVEKLQRVRHETEVAIALLKERRSALIAAAVTGKIDVRQAA